MSYTALYRKFRPSEFEDVKGQDAIVRTLKNQINADRIGHAYLFCGTRGTGKTTVAIARAAAAMLMATSFFENFLLLINASNKKCRKRKMKFPLATFFSF